MRTHTNLLFLLFLVLFWLVISLVFFGFVMSLLIRGIYVVFILVFVNYIW